MKKIWGGSTIVAAFLTGLFFIFNSPVALSAAIVSPIFIQEAETSWSTLTSPKTTAVFNVQAGDLLVAYAVDEDEPGVLGVSGGGLTWTLQQSIDVTAYTEMRVWTAIVDVNKSMSVSFTDTNSARIFGGNVLTFRGTNGVGASAKANISSGLPTVNLTTTADNSAIVVVDGDWNANNGSSRVWRTNAGAFNEKSYFFSSSNYTVYGGYHNNVGAIGTYAVGLSAPTQKYAIIALEVKGSDGVPPPQDTIAPTVSITSPLNGATVSSTNINIQANATDNIGVAGVQFKVDGVNLGAEDTVSPYSIIWNTTSFSNGQHSISVIARDSAGNLGTSSISVIVDNQAPTGTIDINNGATATNSTLVTLNLSAIDNSGPVSQMRFSNTTNNFSTAETYNPLKTWTLTTGSGTKTVRVQFKDSQGNWSGSFSDTIVLDTTAPTISSTTSSNITGNSAGINWTTNEVATSQVEYGLTASYGNLTSIDNNLLTSHQVTISGLNPQTLYNYRVRSKDAAGNEKLGTNNTFVTLSVPDSIPPVVSFSTPANGEIVSGSLTIQANATDNIGVAGVQFKVDGVNLGAEDTVSPYTINWDTNNSTNGIHAISVIARDSAGNSDTVNLNVTVNNSATISGISVTGITETSAIINWSTNNLTDSQINYGTTSDYLSSTIIDTNLVTTHSQTISGLDADTVYHFQILAKNSENLLTVTGDNTFITLPLPDTISPTVSITTPIDGANLSGGVLISADATDNIGVVGVQFKIDGNNLGLEDLSFPYSINLNTTSLSNGLHILNATARDFQANISTSISITINVNNVASISPIKIGNLIAGTYVDATGHSAQSHLVFAQNSNVWWLFTTTSGADSVGGSNHVVKSYYSSGPNLSTASWTESTSSPSVSPINGPNANMGSGQALGVVYINNFPLDIIHAEIAMSGEGQSGTTAHIRAILNPTSISWETWNRYEEGAATWTLPKGVTLGLSSGKYIHSAGPILQQEIDANTRKSANSDTGSSWNYSFSTPVVIDNSMAHSSNFMAFGSLSNNVMIAVYDNGGGIATCYNCPTTNSAPEPNLSNLGYKKSNLDGSWSGVPVGSQGGGDGYVFATNAIIHQNDWTLITLNNSAQYTFRKNATGNGVDGANYNAGTNNWSLMPEQPSTLPITLKSGSGLFSATDGVNIWLFGISTDSANTIYYNKFNGTTWSGWGVVPGTNIGTHNRNYLSGQQKSYGNQIGLVWTEGTTTFDEMITSLGI